MNIQELRSSTQQFHSSELPVHILVDGILYPIAAIDMDNEAAVIVASHEEGEDLAKAEAVDKPATPRKAPAAKKSTK